MMKFAPRGALAAVLYSCSFPVHTPRFRLTSLRKHRKPPRLTRSRAKNADAKLIRIMHSNTETAEEKVMKAVSFRGALTAMAAGLAFAAMLSAAQAQGVSNIETGPAVSYDMPLGAEVPTAPITPALREEAPYPRSPLGDDELKRLK